MEIETRPMELALLKVQEKYIGWFRKRPAQFDGEPHDLLVHYWVNTGDGKFGFIDDSELPKYIQKECYEVVAGLFGN